MSKRSMITHITPLPQSVSRDAAVGLLHSHVNMINLNPLVLRHELTSPPPNATREEAQFMIWYDITDEIQYIPGTAMKSEVTYKAGFYDLPTGLQTHSFAPGGVELLGKWTVGGNMPGEPRELMEMGVDKPKEGLYLREEVMVKCSVLLMGFVKKNLKKSHGVLVKRLVESAQEQTPQLEQPHSIRGNLPTVLAQHHRLVLYEGQYTRIYQPPALYIPQNHHKRPPHEVQKSPDLSRIPSWTITPAEEYPTNPPDDSFRISLDALGPSYTHSAVPDVALNHKHSFDSRTYNGSAQSALAKHFTSDEEDWSAISFGWEPKHFDVGRRPSIDAEPKTTVDVTQKQDDSSLAKRYLEYQARRIAELESS